MSAPDLLVIGHVTTDLVGRRRQLGGAALYSAITASRLGVETALLTSAQPALLSELGQFPFRLASKPSLRTTTFRNTYRDGHRSQTLLDRADPLTSSDVPAEWRNARGVYLAPVAGELGPDLFDIFPRSLRAVGIQGWMRGWDARGNVHPEGLPERGDELRHAHVAFVADDDLPPEPGLMDLYAAHVPCLVVTRGARGAYVYQAGHRMCSAAYATVVADPTGAGDVFAAAFVVRLAEGADPLSAAGFANCAASFVVERRGLEGIPTRSQVEVRLQEGRRLYA